MIRKLRIKFVAVLMSVVTVFLVALLGVLYFASSTHFRQSSMESLRNAIQEGNRASAIMPLIVADVSPLGDVRILTNQIPFITEEDIIADITLISSANTRSGFLKENRLRFMKRNIGPDIVRYAFADTNGEQSSLRALAMHSLWIGIAAFLGLFVFSLMLSGWIVRPVEEAWNKQKQFVADASHELKTPLTTALSNVDMMLSAPASISTEKTKRRLDITKTELVRMKDLVGKLLTLAKADAGRAGDTKTESFSEVDLSQEIDLCASSFEPVFFDNGKILSSSIVPGCTVTGNPEKLRELTGILLDNACKYSCLGSTVKVTLSKDEKKRAHIAVENDGPQIPAESIKRIFERFYRIDESRGEIEGYGLGLAIAKEIAGEHKGEIYAESSANGHTVFHVKLPLTPRKKRFPNDAH